MYDPLELVARRTGRLAAHAVTRGGAGGRAAGAGTAADGLTE